VTGLSSDLINQLVQLIRPAVMFMAGVMCGIATAVVMSRWM